MCYPSLTMEAHMLPDIKDKSNQHSRQVAFAHHIHSSRVCFSLFPKFFQLKNLMLLRFINNGTTYRVESAKSLLVD